MCTCMCEWNYFPEDSDKNVTCRWKKAKGWNATGQQNLGNVIKIVRHIHVLNLGDDVGVPGVIPQVVYLVW